MTRLTPVLITLLAVSAMGFASARCPAAAASLDEIQAKAEAGEARAQMDLGLEYYRGDDAPADLHSAVAWFRKAADQGYAPAEAMLAALYADGAGVPFDLRQSTAWLRRAAAHGLPEAQVKLGRAYGEGLGVPQDQRQAVRWFRAAAEQGDAEGQRLLGEAYLAKRGAAPARALALLQTAADKGDAGAEEDLGRLYEEGEALPLDLVQARKWFELAAKSCQASPVCGSAGRDSLRVKAKMSVIEIDASDTLGRAWSAKADQPAG